MTAIQCITSADAQGYDLALDIRRDTNGRITHGICLGETTRQNQALLLAAHPGDFKEHPTTGVGLADITADHDFAQWRRLIASQIEADGQTIDRLEINEKGLTLEAHY